MRRSFRILAAALMLCLLVGIAAVSAFAATDVEIGALMSQQLKPSGTTQYTSSTYGSGSNSSGNSTVDTKAVDIHGNSYVRYYGSGTSQINTQGSFLSFTAGNTSSSKPNTFSNVNKGVAQYDYTVIDFDFGVDRYQVQVGYKLNTTIVTDKAVTNADGSTTQTTTYTYAIVPAYALYTAETLTEENVKADIKAAYDALVILQRDEDHGCEVISSKVTTTPKGGVATTEEIIAPMKTLAGFDLDDLSKYEMTYEEALATKDLALYSGDQVYLMGRYWANATQTTRTDFSLGVNYKKGSDGKWGYYVGTDKVADLAGEVGKYDHFTFVTRYIAPTGGETVGKSETLIFINGEFARKSDIVDAYSFGLEAIRITVNGTNKTCGGHSYAVANGVVNYYSAGYSSGDAYGIDDFVTGDYMTKSLTECTDVVYTKNYISANGYLRVNTALSKGTPVSHPELVEAELAKIKNGSTLYTTMDVYDLDVPEGVEKFYIECPKDVEITLSAAAKADRFALVKNENGYTVSQDNSSITVFVKWLDIKGNHITTTPIFYGEAPDATGIVANCVDEATNTIYYATVSGWEWDIEGEVGTVTSDIAAAGSTITMTPVIDGEISSVTGATFYMGVRYDDTLVTSPVPASDGKFTKYVNGAAATAFAETKTQTYGNTLVLLADFTGEAGDMAPLAASKDAQVVMTAGTTVNFDLNGHTLIREGLAETFGSDLFRLTEGCSLNVYSTEPGGKIVMGNLRTSAANLVCQSAGIANTNTKVNEASLSVGDIIGKDGSIIAECGNNFTYIGGNVLIATGSKQSASYDANALLKDDKKITVNMNGGYYYPPFRTSYGLICIQCPDVVINVDGVTIVNAYQSSSGIFSDYKEFAANTVATIKNSKIYSTVSKVNASGDIVSNTPSNVINVLNADSTAYFENCVLFGKLVSSLSGKVEIGPGNTIIDASGVIGNAKVSYSAGTSYLKPSNYPFSDTVKHPYANSKWEHDLDLTLSAGATITGAVDTSVEAEFITAASFKTEAYTTFVDVTYSGNVAVVTYDEKNIPDIFATVNWCTSDGEIIDTTNELIGTEPVPPETVTAVVGATYTYKWFVKGFTWSDDAGLVVREGVNNFTPSPFYTAAIRGIKANVTLFEDVVYNLYLPATDLVSGISANGATLNTDTVKIGGEDYITLSIKFAVDDFEAKSATVKFTVDGNELSYDLVFDLLAYATVVGDRYECGSEEAALVFEMLSYKDAVARSAKEGYTAPANLAAYMTKHSGCKCTEASVIELTEAELAVDYSAITEKGVTGIAYVLTLGDIGMAIYTDGTPVESVSYTDDFGRNVIHTLADGGIIEREGYYLVKNVSAAHINNVMTVSIGGATGTYSLAKYIANNPTVEVAKNLYKYALASEDYKYIRESESDKKTYNKMQSVLLMGQSNMTSSNNLYEAVQIEDDRLFMMRNYGWVKMKEPIHTGSSLYGAGIGATFGKAFVETFDVDLGLIPTAKGGTTLQDWRVGGDLYNNAVAMAKAAQETSEICAILWHQGEGDQYNTNYAALLQVIFDALIEELGLDPDKIVIITGELFGTRSDAYHMPQLIELGKHYKNYGIALSDGLTVRDVTTHFDAPSMRVFGYRYFDIFYNLLTGKHYYFNQDPNYYKAIDEQ